MSALLFVAEGDGFVAPGPAEFYQPLIGTGTYAITRPMIMAVISLVLIGWFLLATSSRQSLVPGRLQFVGESLYGFVRNSIARDIIGSHDFMRFVPLLFAQFCLILLNNLFGVIPFIQFPTMSRIGFPIGLTLVVFVVYHWVGVRRKGLGGYFKSMVPGGLPKGMVPAIFFLELVTFFFTRPVTLALRLFANMFAGHLLLLVFILGGEYMLLHGSAPVKGISILAFGLGVVMSFFELLVQVLQAYIFTLLTALYIAGSLADEH